MSVTQQQVLDALAKVASPRGVALTNANVLSAITAADGKVFFSINVDAAEARAWESVRAQAEAAVRAIPGVTVAMIALTAERKPGAASSPSPGAARAATGAASASPCAWRAAGVGAQAAAKPGVADVQAGGNSGRRRRHRGGLGQGRRRQVDHRAQSRAGPARSRPARRSARRRYLRPLGAAADRHSREAETERRPQDDSDRALRSFHHVDRLPGRGRNRDDLARTDGDVGDHPDAARRGVGHARYSRGRHAARHRRRAADAGAERAAEGRGHHLDPAGSLA